MSGRVDMTGRRFGKLTVLEYAGAYINRSALWRCRCDCGNEIIVLGSLLRDGRRTDCGCVPKERGRHLKDRVGLRYGALTVLSLESRDGKASLWRCRCDCGNEILARGNYLTENKVLSCGCQKKPRRTNKAYKPTDESEYGKAIMAASLLGAHVIDPKESRDSIKAVCCLCAVTRQGNVLTWKGYWRQIKPFVYSKHGETKRFVSLPIYGEAGKKACKAIPVHQLMADAWLPAPSAEPSSLNIHHKDFNGLNNTPENLVWLTPEQHKNVHRQAGIPYKGFIYANWGGVI